MFCSECGKKIPDNSKFCMFCGNSVVFADQSDVPVKRKKQVTKTEAPIVRSVVNAVNKSHSSVVVLVAAIFYSFAILFDLIASMIDSEVFTLFAIGNSYLGIGYKVAVWALFIPTCLIIAGIWTNFCLGRNLNNTKTIGLSLVQAGNITRIVLHCIFFVLLLAMFFICITAEDVARGKYDILGVIMSPEEVNAMSAISLTVAITQIFPVIYDVFALISASNLKKAMKNNRISGKGSLVSLVVVNFIIAAVYVVSLPVLGVLSEMMTLLSYRLRQELDIQNLYLSLSPLRIIVPVLMIVVLILFSVNLIIYMAKAKKVKNEDTCEVLIGSED